MLKAALKRLLVPFLLSMFSVDTTAAQSARPDPSWRAFNNKAYGFEIRFPPDYSLLDHFTKATPKDTAVYTYAHLTNGTRSVFVHVQGWSSGFVKPNEKLDFLPYARSLTVSECAADGDCSSDCEIKSESEITYSKFKGVRFDVDLITTCVNPDIGKVDLKKTERKPPVYVFDISNNQKKGTLIFQRVFDDNPMSDDVLDAIISTLRPTNE